MQIRILVADDEKLIRDYIANFFAGTENYRDYKVDLAVSGEEAIARIKEHSYDLVFTDLKMPGKNGLEVIKYVGQHHPETDTVLMTAYAGGESAAQAMAWGAYEYLQKPVSIDELEFIVKRIIERRKLIEQNNVLRAKALQRTGYPKLIGASKSMHQVMELIKVVAPTNSTVLITGESGTGKELAAEAIHMLSPRATNKYVRINCAALPEHLIESELFGFEKGAFTGAIRTTRGKFEVANGGSLLLDEISEMAPDLQSKLLRVIQEKEITRIGSESSFKIDTRIIATSNRELEEEVKKGNFRQDLFFRLNIVPIEMPPLRQRKDDIPAISEHFIKATCFDLGVDKKSLTQEALDVLMSYNYPGNIRELQNLIQRAVITWPERLLPAKAFAFIPGYQASNPAPVINNQAAVASAAISKDKAENTAEPAQDFVPNATDNTDTVAFTNRSLADIEKEIILRTLQNCNNNKTEAAKILGVTSRTLRNKLKLYDGEGEE